MFLLASLVWPESGWGLAVMILSAWLIAASVIDLDLTTHVSALKKTGAKPLLMALVLFAWLIVGGGAINYVIQSVIA